MNTPTPTIYPDYTHGLSPTISRWCPLRAIDIYSLRNVGMFADGKPLYHLSNHPIKWIRINGVIVAIDAYEERKVLTVDDSSGAVIECICASPPKEAKDGINTIAAPALLAQINKLQHEVQARNTSHSHSAAKTGISSHKGTSKEAQPSVKAPQVPWAELDVGIVVKVKGLVTKFRDTMQIEVIKLEIMRSSDAEVKCWDEVLAFRIDVLRRPWVVSAEEEEACRRERQAALRMARKGGAGSGAGADRGRWTAEEERGGKRPGAGERRTEESNRRGEDGEKGLVKRAETDEERRPKHKARKRPRKREEGLDGRDRINYPSGAVRRRVAGK